MIEYDKEEIIFTSSRKEKSKTFKISNATIKEIGEVCELHFDNFYNYEPLTIAIKPNREIFKEESFKNVRESFNNGSYVFVIRELGSEKIICVLIACDMFDHEPDSGCFKNEKERQPYGGICNDIFDFIPTHEETSVEKPGEVMEIDTISTDANYWGFGLATKLIDYLINIHPITSTFKRYIINASNEGSKVIAEKNGFKIVQRARYDKFVNKKGEYPFIGIKQILINKKLPISEEGFVLILDK